MEIFNKVKNAYITGFRFAFINGIDGLFILQVAYISAVIAEIIVLNSSSFFAGKGITYSLLMIFHVFSMYVLGYKKDSWEGSILQGSYKEQEYQLIYIFSNIGVLLLTLKITSSLLGILVFIAPAIVAVLLILIASFIARFVQFENLCYVPIIVFLVIVEIFLSVSLLLAITVNIVFVFFIPLIVLGADNGMNFLSFYNFSWVY